MFEETKEAKPVNVYQGKFYTQKYNGSERTALIRDITYIIRDVFRKIDENPGLIMVDSHGSLVFPEITVRDKYPNLFLPETDWHETNYTSFDTVISYVLYELGRSGHMYNGTVEVSSPIRLAKLVARDSNVYCFNGEVKIVYNEESSYQVGGINL